MTRSTIAIAHIRAMDIQPDDVIRLTPTDKWRWVYDAGDNPDTEAAQRIVNEDLDQRYVLVRVSDDPPMKIVEDPKGIPQAWLASKPGWTPSDPYPGVPGEFEDLLVVLRQYDLVEAQLPRPGRGSRDDQVLYVVTAAEVDAIAEREITDVELARIAKAIGHSSIPEALSEVVFAVCGSAESEDEPYVSNFNDGFAEVDINGDPVNTDDRNSH